MGHYEHWREDIALARDVGMSALRWGVPWYRVEPHHGKFDWSWTDQVLPYMVEEMGITPIIDLMHYGCPLWLRREFANARYPRAVGDYAAAFARRYKGLVRWYTPLNEPIINSLMCGKRGLWPPYLRGENGYIRMMLQLVRGIFNTVEAIKEIDPDSVMVHVEATGLSRAARQDLEVLAIEERRRGFLCYDLLTGRVTHEHPLFPWLVYNGASPNDLSHIASRAIRLDVIGMNFYPLWSTQELHLDKRGRLAYRPTDPEGSGFAKLIEEYYDRYKVPIIITETSAHLSDETRSRWLEQSLSAIKALRGQGVPVHGYTWFPLFTMVDWRYRFGQGPVEDYYIELGLYTLSREAGEPRWLPTPLVAEMRDCINNPEQSIGHLEGITESDMEIRKSDMVNL
jgi:beta-glucosidase/6-phospho-beta-glucosidase/beta-galactosidase